MKDLKKLIGEIGRWILQRIIKHGRVALIHYMEGKVGDFARRLAKAKTPRRRRWLRGRIKRWNAVTAWLTKHGEKFGTNDFKAFDRAIGKAVPVVAVEENDVADAA